MAEQPLHAAEHGHGDDLRRRLCELLGCLDYCGDYCDELDKSFKQAMAEVERIEQVLVEWERRTPWPD